MAETFAAPSYSVEKYASFRPTYPPELYEAILDYHQAETDLALDLGCGTGIVSGELVQQEKFTRVIGVDPSKSMLDYARRTTTGAEFVHGRAESLPWIPDSTVDLIVAGTAAHWFEPTWWKEAERVLKPNGTIAVFIYGGLWPDPSHPHADELRGTMFSFAEDLGFSSQGNIVCHGMYDQLPMPTTDRLGDFERIDWNRDGLGDRLVMAKRMNLKTWRERVYTYGPAHRWRLDNPSLIGNKRKDPVERTVERLKDILGTTDESTEIVCGHSLTLLLFRRRLEC